MSRRANGASTAPSSSSHADTSSHPGFVNLGNTCFLNSVLQATSATKSLKQLYHPDALLDLSALEALRDQGQDTSTSSHNKAAIYSALLSSEALEQLNVRSKSPVLQLADEEHGRFISRPTSRRTSSTVDSSIAAALLRQAGNKEEHVTERTESSAVSSARTSLDTRATYEPRSSDLPLNTAFRQVMEKTWKSEEKQTKHNGKSANTPKVPPVNPKRILNIMSQKYDQYGEYAQQDGHELLRQLLDSLRMEELDVIKKLQPPVRSASKVQRRKGQRGGDQPKSQEEKLQPFVDNIFCGKLLSCVVCEGCRHVSHTYEDFYDISLSLRPEADMKNVGKRDRMKSISDRWRRATSSKGTAGSNGSSSSGPSKATNDSLAMLTDGLMGSISDSEEAVDGKIKRSASRSGRSIIRPKSAAAGQNAAIVDAVSRESAKTFMLKNFQPSDPSLHHLDVDKMSISMHSEEKKKESSQGAVALLRAVSIKSRPSSRGSSPMREEINNLVEKSSSRPQHHHHHHLLHLPRHETKPKRSKQGIYLAKLLLEVTLPATPSVQSNALLWGRRIGTPNQGDPGHASGKVDAGMDIIGQQSGTGLVKALSQFTSVEVLDGANSFACKRCWRILNPPTVQQDAKVRLRRMRRGKDEDDSERSSDDDTSSDEEEKEQNQLEEWTVHSLGDSKGSLSSLGSTKPERQAGQAHADRTQPVQSIPSIEMTSPLVSSPNSKELSDPETASTPTGGPPLLQAPKAIMAGSKGLTLGQPLSRANSSDEDDSNGEINVQQESGSSSASDDEEIAREEGEVGREDSKQTQIEAGSVSAIKKEMETRKTKTIEFLDQQKVDRGKNKPPMAMTAATGTRKRSTHSLPKRALKRFLLSETPKVFVFHFKRFHATGRGFSSYSFSNSYKKIDDYVSFPEYLDVKPWLAPPREDYSRSGQLKSSSDPKALAKAKQEEEEEKEGDSHSHEHDGESASSRWGWRPRTPSKEPQGNSDKNDSKTKYRLYAVIVHSGSMSGGHYTAFVLSDRINVPPSSSPSSSAKDKASSAETSQSVRSSSNTTAPLSEDEKKKKTKATTIEEGASTASSNNDTSPIVNGSDRVPSASSDGGLRSSLSISSLDSSVGGEKLSSVPSKATTTSSASENHPGGGGEAAADTSASKIDRAAIGLKKEQKKDDRRWIYASDTVVRGASIDEVLKAQAYMLFYEQL